VVAAVLSGIAFFLVLNTLWGRPPATGKNYVVQFAAWVGCLGARSAGVDVGLFIAQGTSLLTVAAHVRECACASMARSIGPKRRFGDLELHGRH
jgi:hypothetical protein